MLKRHNRFIIGFGAYALCALLLSAAFLSSAQAQDVLPADNGLATYHTSPRYRESESHPLRVLAYVFHPVGWVLREVIFRPLSYFASSTENTRSVMGYREPYDFREPECFSADNATPDCRALTPFNYGRGDGSYSRDDAGLDKLAADGKEVFFPNVNFDFDKRTLNSSGIDQAKRVAELLEDSAGGVRIVLQGHTDYLGSDSYNLKLGMDRAEAVKAELVRLGVSASRLSTISFGESKPLDEAKTDSARAVNRRVETHLSEATK